jgi:hypothetical protein
MIVTPNSNVKQSPSDGGADILVRLLPARPHIIGGSNSPDFPSGMPLALRKIGTAANKGVPND